MHFIGIKSISISYTDDTNLSSPLLAFTIGANCNIDAISYDINKETKK